jgi:tagatose-6-phosphate ketose/aldose isomerase
MSQSPLRHLAAEPEEVQREKGTFHTPGEILQQPSVWRETAARVTGLTTQAAGLIQGSPAITITGAGSSLHAGRLMEAAARTWLRSAITVVSCTDLMFAPEWYLPARGRGVLLSLSRSGESPEIVEAARLVQEHFKDIAQIAVTCNPAGQLARVVEGRKDGLCVTLPERSYDRGMGTTSSVTSTVVAGRYLVGLVHPDGPQAYRDRVEVLSDVAEAFIEEHAGTAEAIARTDPGRVVALGTLPLEAAAQEVAHKVLELTDGQVPTVARNFLEFRHGPIAFIDRSTTVICLVSSNPEILAYERDFIRQLRQSQAAQEIVIVGSEHPEMLEGIADRVIPFPAGKCNLGERSILGVVFGQMLALFLSLRRGLRPDVPGSRGLVHPIVQGVTIYPRKGKP